MDIKTILYVFSAIGVADTLYLIYHMLSGTDVACPFFPKKWCQTVQYNPYSKTMGVPNPVAGFGMYLVILVLTWLYAEGSIAFWPLQVIIAFGFIFSMYFTYVQAFILRSFCTWWLNSPLN